MENLERDRAKRGRAGFSRRQPRLETRDWTALPHDVLCEIFRRTRHANILCGAGLACTSWRRVAADEPTLWRCIDLNFEEDEKKYANERVFLERLALARAAVDRSRGQCESFRGPADRRLLAHLAASAPLLRSLDVSSFWCLPNNMVTPKIPMSAVTGGPLLISSLRALLRRCPLLELLRAGDCFLDKETTPRRRWTKCKIRKTEGFELRPRKAGICSCVTCQLETRWRKDDIWFCMTCQSEGRARARYPRRRLLKQVMYEDVNISFRRHRKFRPCEGCGIILK